MAIRPGISTAARIAAALGLPEKTRSFTLSAGVDRATTVTVEYFVGPVDFDKLPQLNRETWTLKQPEEGDADGN